MYFVNARLLNTQRERILTIERAQARMHRNVQSVSRIIVRYDNKNNDEEEDGDGNDNKNMMIRIIVVSRKS